MNFAVRHGFNHFAARPAHGQALTLIQIRLTQIFRFSSFLLSYRLTCPISFAATSGM